MNLVVPRCTQITAALLCPLLLVAFMGLHTLGTSSLLIDENTTYQLSSLPLKELFQELPKNDPHPPLYFIVMHFVLKISESEFALRLFSLVCGLASLPLVYLLCRPVLGQEAGFWTVALLAVNSMFLFCCRFARMYSLLFLLVVVSLYAYVVWFTRPSVRTWLLLCAASVAMLYTHYFGVLIIALETIHFATRSLVCSVRGRSRAGKLVSSNLGAYASYIAVVGLSSLPFWHWYGKATARNVPVNVPNLSLAWLAQSFKDVLSWPYLEGAFVPLVVTVVMGILCTVGIVQGLRTNPLWGSFHVLVLLSVPCVVLASLAYFKNNYAPRFFVVLLPSLFMFCGKGCAWVCRSFAEMGGLLKRRRWSEHIILTHLGMWLLLIALPMIKLIVPRLTIEPYPWKEVGGFLSHHIEDGDAVVLTGIDGQCLPYYLKDAPDFHLYLTNRIERIEELRLRHRSTWMVAAYPPVDEPLVVSKYEELKGYLLKGCSTIRRFGGRGEVLVGTANSTEKSASAYEPVMPRVWSLSDANAAHFFSYFLWWIPLEPKEYRQRMLSVATPRMFSSLDCWVAKGEVTAHSDAKDLWSYVSLESDSLIDFRVLIEQQGEYKVEVAVRNPLGNTMLLLVDGRPMYESSRKTDTKAFDIVDVYSSIEPGRHTVTVGAAPAKGTSKSSIDVAWVRLQRWNQHSR